MDSWSGPALVFVMLALLVSAQSPSPTSNVSQALMFLMQDACYGKGSSCDSCTQNSGCIWCVTTTAGISSCMAGGLTGATQLTLCNQDNGHWYYFCTIDGNLMTTNWTYVIFIAIICFIAVLLVGLCICVISACRRGRKKRTQRENLRRAKTQAKIAELKAKEEKAKADAASTARTNGGTNGGAAPVVMAVSPIPDPNMAEQQARDERLRREQDAARQTIRDRRSMEVDENRVDALAAMMAAESAPAQDSSSSAQDSASSSSFAKGDDAPASPKAGGEDEVRELRKNLSTQDIDRIIDQMNTEFGDKPGKQGEDVSEGWKEASSDKQSGSGAETSSAASSNSGSGSESSSGSGSA